MVSSTSQSPTGPEGKPGASSVFLHVLRGILVLALCSVGMSLVSTSQNLPPIMQTHKELVFIAFALLGILVVAMDVFIPRKSLTALSGLFFGLVVGMLVAYGLSLVVDLVAQVVYPDEKELESVSGAVSGFKVAIGLICCYLSVSFIFQTKDDVRFVIPYVEFSKQAKGVRPLILDTSVIIDGRIADIAETRVLESEMIIPRFVLQELQTIADSGDKLKRTRGRRGLDMLNKLQSSEKTEIRILDLAQEDTRGIGVDELLVDLAVELGGKIVTNDYNLNKIAQLRGVTVININDLANALKPVVLPGEALTIKVIKPGEEVGQGVGYLEDGTMVVAEGGRDHIGEEMNLTVTSVLQTSAGRMIFGRAEGAPVAERRRPRPGKG